MRPQNARNVLLTLRVRSRPEFNVLLTLRARSRREHSLTRSVRSTMTGRMFVARFALAIAVWLAAGQMTLADGVAFGDQSALTLTLSQGERGQFDLSQADAPASPLEEQFFADAADGQLDDFSPLGAALVASGVADAESLAEYEQKAAALADELRQSGKVAGTARQQAEAIFNFLHRRILRGEYHIAPTDLRRTLDNGQFNCVSASVMFNYLAGEFGLNCRGLELPGHAMSRVILPEKTGDCPLTSPLDIETTCPTWFRMIGDPKRQAAGAGKGDSPRPTSGRCPPERPGGCFAQMGTVPFSRESADRSKAREVSPIEIAAMIYYNRGVDLLGEKRFAEAAAVNAKALRLDPTNAIARGNLLATLNNWSIELGNDERFAEAIDVLRQGLTLDAKFAAFAQNYVHVHHLWVEHLCRVGQYDEALDILSRAEAEMPDQQYLHRAHAEVYARWSKTMSDAPSGGASLRLPCVKRNATVD